jgi:hypothetical protein
VRVSRVDPGRPFRLRRLDIAHEAVEMLDQRLHDLPQARIGNVLPALKHHIGEVVFGHIGHGCLLESVLLELFSRDLLPHAISRGRYFLAAKAAGAGVSFPLADTVFNTSFPSGCSIRFHLLKAYVIARLTHERVPANRGYILVNPEEVIWIVFDLARFRVEKLCQDLRVITLPGQPWFQPVISLASTFSIISAPTGFWPTL